MAKFITFEGIEGVGKSTAIHYVFEKLSALKIDVVLTREPGGTPFAEKIRDLLLHADVDEVMTGETEVLLMFASRAQHIARFIKPALAKGRWVLCDRYTDSSIAYQGAGRGLPLQQIEQLADWISLTPDITILLDAPVELGMQRAQKRKKLDRIEQEEKAFFERARAGFLRLASQHPKRYRVIDTSGSLLEVNRQLDVVIAEMQHDI